MSPINLLEPGDRRLIRRTTPVAIPLGKRRLILVAAGAWLVAGAAHALALGSDTARLDRRLAAAQSARAETIRRADELERTLDRIDTLKPLRNPTPPMPVVSVIVRAIPEEACITELILSTRAATQTIPKTGSKRIVLPGYDVHIEGMTRSGSTSAEIADRLGSRGDFVIHRVEDAPHNEDTHNPWRFVIKGGFNPGGTDPTRKDAP